MNTGDRPIYLYGGTWELVGGEILHNVHMQVDCLGSTCAIHGPSAHHMRTWDQFYGPDTGITRRCSHGEYHTDPDDHSDREFKFKGVTPEEHCFCKCCEPEQHQTKLQIP